jgi:hypothetical protein
VQRDAPACRDGQLLAHGPILQAVGGFDLHDAGGNRHLHRAHGVEIGVFEATLPAIEAIVGVTQGVVGSEGAPVGTHHGQARRHRLPGGSIHDVDDQGAHGSLAPPLLHPHSRPLGSRNLQDPEGGVAGLVGDVGDAGPVRRPARRRRVVVAVGDRERVSPLGGHEPELVPLTAQVGAVDHALPVPGPVRTRLPARLLLAHLAQGRPGSGVHAPEAAGAPDASPVRDQEQLAAVGGPAGGQVVVETAVVITRQAALHVLGQALGRPAPGGHREDVPASVENRRDEGDAPAIGGEARLHVDGSVRRHGARLPGPQVQEPQLDGIAAIRGVGHAAPVGGPVRLVVVSRAVGELRGRGRAQRLPPERALHRVDELPAVGRPGDGAGAARDLGQVHLSVVVAVRDLDLLENRLPGGECRTGEQDEGRGRQDSWLCQGSSRRDLGPAGGAGQAAYSRGSARAFSMRRSGTSHITATTT